MRFLSIFSGVEAASVAWLPLGWECVAVCEVDKHASEVLSVRFPDVPNLGDITEVDWKEFNDRYGAVDVVVGGSPCQSFSIAGNREGLDGESRLMFEYIRCVREVVPRYFVWENVPGCLSSNKGRDFACLLEELEDCGYGMAWRVLDAQFARVPGGPRLGFFGPVPQRRRRVFLVGSLGSTGAAEILFERSCLRGNHPKGREAREALAGDPAEGVAGGYCAGFKYHQGGQAGSIGYEEGQSPTLTADYHQPAVLTPWDVQSKRVNTPEGTSPTLPSGTNEGMNIQPIVMTTANTNANGSNVNTDGASYTLDGANSNAVAFAQNTRDEVRLFGGDGQTVGALSAQPGMKQTSYVMTQYGDNLAGSLTARADSSPCADRGQNVVCMQVYKYVCCSCGHRFESSDGPIEGYMDEDWFKITCPECGSGRYIEESKVSKVICVADDNAKAAIESDMSGSLKVGGGAP